MHDLLSSLTPPPDLLLRFTETPIHQRLHVHGVCVHVMTNEAALTAALSEWESGDADGQNSREMVTWKLIVDAAAGAPAFEPQVTDSGAVITAWFAPGTLLALDPDCAEACAFVPPASENFCRLVMFPLLARWIEEGRLWRRNAGHRNELAKRRTWV
jgi:hypothetical protein